MTEFLETEEQKLRAIGLIAEDRTPANLRKIAEEEKIPYSKLIKWRAELDKTKVDGSVEVAIQADQVLIHRIAEETKKELSELPEGTVVEGDIDAVVSGLTGLDILSTTTQSAALRLAKRVDHLALGCTDARELQSLVTSICALQVAFFNKQTTQVNVQNNTYTSDAVSKFKGLKKA